MNTCIISGTSSGIGRATAIMLSQMNIYKNIVFIGRNIGGMEETVREMSSDVNVSIRLVDLCIPQDIPSVIEDIAAQYGTIDCLINVAGYTEPASLFATSYENIMTTYSVNVFAPLVLIKECAKHMKKRGGKILNVASTAGMTPRPGWISYSSSKAALISISQTLTEELAEYGIKIYCISPGRCATKLRKKLAPDEDPETIMQPEEVAKVICELIDTKESCLDGQNIVIRKKH